jgi:hypothetical protein
MPQRKPPKPKPAPKTYDYMLVPKTGKAFCFASKNDNCVVAMLQDAGRSDFHDAELQNATAEINRILDSVARNDTDSSRHLAFVTFQGRLMLVRAHHDQVLTNANDDREVAGALKVKARR